MWAGSDLQKANLAAGRVRAHTAASCSYCGDLIARTNLRKHERACHKNPSNIRPCPVCGGSIKGKGVTCSHSCANRHFRTGRDHPNWKDETYRSTCFAHHERRCVICGESNIVSVHHMNEDHADCRPENLVPLCPTHHQYWHSRYRHLVEATVREYLESKFPACSAA